MKTTNNVQKTENRNSEKSSSKFLAVVASLVLISLTVTANDFWKQLLTNNTYGKMGVLMVDQENESKQPLAFAAPEMTNNTTEASHGSLVFYIEPAREKNLEIENWMTKETLFTSVDRVASEKPLEIEGWMLNDQNFGAGSDTEPALEIENWMVNSDFWTN